MKGKTYRALIEFHSTNTTTARTLLNINNFKVVSINETTTFKEAKQEEE